VLLLGRQFNLFTALEQSNPEIAPDKSTAVVSFLEISAAIGF
jgi:hypothetical protein